MKKVLKFALIAVAVLIFAGTFVFLYSKSKPAVVAYAVEAADTARIERTTIVTGTIEPRDEVLIKPQISGIIAELYKETGETVRQGEIIAKVKVIPEMSSLNASENRVRLANLNAKQVETDYGRMKQLYEQQLVSAEEYEKSRLTWQQAKEEARTAADALQIVREGVSSSNASYSTTLIRSTIDGLILDVPVKVGNSVIQSNTFNDGTTIASVADMSDLIFKGSIDETEVARLREGMPMHISIGALPEMKFTARLEYIAPKVASGTNSANQFEIKAAVSVPDGVKIRAGYSANAEIVLERAESVLSVPEGCMEFVGDSTFVYLLTSENPQTFERRSVITGLSDGIRIEVKQGLKQGEKVRGNQIQDLK